MCPPVPATRKSANIGYGVVQPIGIVNGSGFRAVTCMEPRSSVESSPAPSTNSDLPSNVELRLEDDATHTPFGSELATLAEIDERMLPVAGSITTTLFKAGRLARTRL